MPLEIKALKRIYAYILEVKMMPATHIPRIAWDAGCAPQKTRSSKFLTSSFVQDIRKWFTKWNVETYIDMPIDAGKQGECLLNFDIALLDQKSGKRLHHSKYESYCKHVNPRYWEAYETSQPEAQAHIRIPMPHMARRAITLMRTRSHMLKIETGGWLKTDAQKRTCMFCNMQASEDEKHVALRCPAYKYIRANFQ